RRHTRWPRDWSSDVCSSDLVLSDKDELFKNLTHELRHTEHHDKMVLFLATLCEQVEELAKMLPKWWSTYFGYTYAEMRDAVTRRSEERRVGKECRCRRWAYQ